MKEFYNRVPPLDRLKAAVDPTADDVREVLGIIADDDALGTYFYEDNRNEKWVPLLRDAGEFARLEGTEDKVGLKERVQAEYLARVAERNPRDVLDVIGSIEPGDSYIKSQFMEALLKMLAEDSVRGTWFVLRYLHGKTAREWYLIGELPAKLMERFAERYPNEAFAIAEELLEVWVPSGSEKSIFDNIDAKFPVWEYKNIALGYYARVVNTHPLRGAGVLLKVFNKYLGELNEVKGADVSDHFYITMENLDAIERVDRDYIAILVKAVCDAGRVTIEKQPQRAADLFRLLKSAGKTIFNRIEMYLLRFVPSGTYRERITQILLDKTLFESPGFRYEYDLLLRDKIDDVRDAVEPAYKKWIDGMGLSGMAKEGFAKWFKETQGRESTPDDVEKYMSGLRAARVYLVSSRLPELYTAHKERAGLSDLQLMPRPMIEAGDVAVAADSPIAVEDMTKMEPGSVLDYLLDPTNYEGKQKLSTWHEPKESLTYVFGEVVRQRLLDYVNHTLNEKVVRLDSIFLGTYLNRVMAGAREKEVGIAFWGPWLELAQLVVEKGADRPEYRGCLSDILWTIQEGLGGRHPIECEKKNAETIWRILKPLVTYEGEKQESKAEGLNGEDPMHTRCKSICGEALAQVVSFAIRCKENQKDYYDGYLQGEVRTILDYVVSEVKRPEVNCTLGSDLTRIHWLDEDWLRNRLDKILEGAMWDAVWGTYMAWGRPWLRTFRLLAGAGKYQRAIELIGTPNKYSFGKDPDEGLTEHLMIALFNGWFANGCKDRLLWEFLEKAPAKLRAHAAEFLTTGFESLKEEKTNRGAVDRLRTYWEMRLSAMGSRGEQDLEEAVAFVSWAEDSPIEAPETLRLLQETLQLTGGRLGDQGYHFIKAICTAGKGNELAALQCLNMAVTAMADYEAHTHFSLYKKELTEFLAYIREMADDHANISDIRREAMQLADTYGRRHVYEFRGVFESLSQKMGGA